MSIYRCTIAGQQCQDIIEYARHCELFNCFQSKDVKDMDDIESSANPRWDADYHDYANGLDVLVDINNAGDGVDVFPTGDRNEWGRIDKRYTRHSLCGIPGANGKARFSHKPCCGIGGHGGKYYLPLRLGCLELEWTIASDGTLPVVVPQGTGTSPTGDKEGYYFTPGDTSVLWELNNLLIRAEVVSLDNTVANKISSHILSGNSLKMYFPMYHTITQTFDPNAGEITMNIVKSASKLSGTSLHYTALQGQVNYVIYRYSPDNDVYKRWNYFYNPMINGEINDVGAANTDALQGKGFADHTRQLSHQMQIQSTKYPEFEAQSLSETFYYLRQAIHYMNPEQESLSFSYRQYRENKFIIGMSFEKMYANGGVSFTGVNTKMGSLMTFKLKLTEGKTQGRDYNIEGIEELFVHLTSDAIVELRSDGAILYD